MKTGHENLGLRALSSSSTRQVLCSLVVIAALASSREAQAAGDNSSSTEPPLSSAEAAKHSVLAHPAFWLIPESQGCVATTTRALGAPPVAAAAAWDSNVWVCTFTREFGVARCQNLSRVEVKTRKSAALTDVAFVVRPDRNPSWAATFGGLTDAFISDHESLATNARREYLLQTDTFKQNPVSTVHTVCTGRWEPLTAKDLADLAKKPGPTPPTPAP